MKLLDCFLFFNEQELLEERINALNGIVDVFIIIEFGETFSGQSKRQSIDLSVFGDEIYQKIKYCFIPKTNFFGKDDCLARTNLDRNLIWKHSNKPPKNLHESNLREINQRDSIASLIWDYAEDIDLIMVSDIDEIPDPLVLQKLKINFKKYLGKILYLEMDWRIFYSDLKCNDPWYGTYITNKARLKSFSVDELRVSSKIQGNPDGEVIEKAGVHLSYLGGLVAVKRKLDALGAQGMRVRVSKLLVNRFPKLVVYLMKIGFDLLLQGRTLKLIEKSEISYLSSKFMRKYSLSNTGNTTDES